MPTNVKHSPGPWQVTYKHGKDCMPTGVHDPSGRTVCQQNWMMSRGGNQAEVEANARLIAAAPELEELLQIVQAGFAEDPGTSDLDDEQSIHVRMTLGDYRRIKRLLWKIGGQQ